MTEDRSSVPAVRGVCDLRSSSAPWSPSSPWPRLALVGALVVLLAGWAGAASQTAEPIDIPYTRYVLDNGLTLIVHEDHKAPIVAVNVWYHVGSKNEQPGRTGFAHLFEHLMFNGSEHFDDDFFKAFDRAGATEMNGTTNVDRTNYFENVPTPALDMALWMESDRMGYLLGAIDRAKLDEQRGVVQNEKRQGENQPYGVTRQLLVENTYPPGHPYSWTTIGSMQDLEAATLEDVRTWFRSYYGAANAIVVVAGDVEAEAVRAKVERYFGAIPSGPPLARHETWIAKRSGTRRTRVQDRVPQPRLYKVWNIPEWGSYDGILLRLVSDVLSDGKSSRLYRRLVYDDQVATAASAFVQLREIGGQLTITATARPGTMLDVVERAVDEELERFIEEGPTDEELGRVKAAYRASFLRRAERVGGFGGKSDVLAQGYVYAGRPDFYATELQWVAEATGSSLQDVARRWLSDGAFVLEVEPFPDHGVSTDAVDRSTGPPAVGPPPTVTFPDLERTTLANGLEVVLARRPGAPVVSVEMLFDAGFASDANGLPGTASLAMGMLDEGTDTRSALDISDELQRLGARLSAGSDLDTSSILLSALRESLAPSLELFADVVQHPAFPAEDFDRLKHQLLARIDREKSSPEAMAQRVLPALLYGPAHPYGQPFTGSGSADSVPRITREELQRFHDTWIRPDNATLMVTGALSMDEIRPELERLFADWTPGAGARTPIPHVAPRTSTDVYVVHRPGAQQSIIFAGQLAPPTANPDETGIEVLNTILGGTFSSRINTNLREEKHWSYGARSYLLDAHGQRPFIVYAPVQTDKTKESMAELRHELRVIRGERPPTEDELAKAKDLETLTFPGRWETVRAIASDVSTIVAFGLPDDYFATYPAKVRALQTTDLTQLAERLLQPDTMVWVIVGDREQIEAGIRELGFGTIHFIDADGRPPDE